MEIPWAKVAVVAGIIGGFGTGIGVAIPSMKSVAGYYQTASDVDAKIAAHESGDEKHFNSIDANIARILEGQLWGKHAIAAATQNIVWLKVVECRSNKSIDPTCQAAEKIYIQATEDERKAYEKASNPKGQ